MVLLGVLVAAILLGLQFTIGEPVYRRVVATFADGRTAVVSLKRKRFPWPSRNVCFGRTIYEGGPLGMNDATMRHELYHVYQYITRGWWWVFTHPRQREAEARAVHQSDYPKWRNL